MFRSASAAIHTAQDLGEIYGVRVVRPPSSARITNDVRQGFGAVSGWQRGGEYVLTPEEGVVGLVLVLDGGCSFAIQGSHFELRADDLIMHGAGTPVTVQAPEACSLAAWWFTPTVLRGRRFQQLHDHPIRLGPQGREVALGVTRAVLTMPPAQDPRIAIAHQWSLEHTFAALLLEHPGIRATPPASGTVDTVLNDAQRVIESAFHDPRFDVNRLAAHLHVSRSTLHRAYSLIDTTPRAEILARRLAEARAILDDAQGAAHPALMRLAAEAGGFSSVRQLRRILSIGRW